MKPGGGGGGWGRGRGKHVFFYLASYQRSYQPGLSTLQLDKKYLQKCHRIFSRDREPRRIPAVHEHKMSEQQEQKG